MSDLSAFERMVAGEVHASNHPDLFEKLAAAADKMAAYNAISPNDFMALVTAIKDIVNPQSKLAFVKPPFFFEYGENILFGEQNFVNMNCTFLDSGKITIGDFTAIGPNCQFITVTHPVKFEERLPIATEGPLPRTPMSYTRPITIGSKCWIGAGVTILPGVTIGDGAVIGAGAVVSKDVAPNTIAAGVPCKPIRTIAQD